MTKNKIWRITQQQIVSGDIDAAIILVDPEQIADANIVSLAGKISLRVEDAERPVDIFFNPGARTFFRSLHSRWPWAAYFLRLQPITASSPLNQIVDVSMFISLTLCHVDGLTHFENARGSDLRYNRDQFYAHLAELRGRAAQLAAAVGIPNRQIKQRDHLISRTVDSFFQAGRAINLKTRKQK